MISFGKFLVLSLVLTGCASGSATAPLQEAVQISAQPILAVELPDSIVLGDTLVFTATVLAPDPCWSLDHFEISTNGRQTQITAFAQRGPETCSQIISRFSAQGRLVPTVTGPLTISFVSYPNTIVRTVQVRSP